MCISKNLNSGQTCLVRIFSVDVVLDGVAAFLVEVLGSDLHQIRDFRLEKKSDCQVPKFCIEDVVYQDEHCGIDKAAVLCA